VADAVRDLEGQVEGSIAVITSARWESALVGLAGGRVSVIDPLSTKGLEWDATVVVDPDQIIAESPGGARVLYVALTRAAHRMTVIQARHQEVSS
jgi:superfamily I DNA/RNA helicase